MTPQGFLKRRAKPARLMGAGQGDAVGCYDQFHIYNLS
jgi:hypothetical protein